uniref:Uncharacterized protein n=1 Tax=Oryza punctata TaxID=4537 RepID=A0A0E0JED6_ORYPU
MTGSRPVEGRRTGVAEVTCYRSWACDIRVGRRQTTAIGIEDPRRKLSPVFHWTGSGYAFGRGNLLGGVVKVASSLDEDL